MGTENHIEKVTEVFRQLWMQSRQETPEEWVDGVNRNKQATDKEEQ